MSEIGSPRIHSMLSPGVMHDVRLTVGYTPTTPRQSINSLPTPPRQRGYDAFVASPWDPTNALRGLQVVQVDDEHFFARWRYKEGLTEFDTNMESAWHKVLDPPWLRGVRSERT